MTADQLYKIIGQLYAELVTKAEEVHTLQSTYKALEEKNRSLTKELQDLKHEKESA